MKIIIVIICLCLKYSQSMTITDLPVEVKLCFEKISSEITECNKEVDEKWGSAGPGGIRIGSKRNVCCAIWQGDD